MALKCVSDQLRSGPCITAHGLQAVTGIRGQPGRAAHQGAASAGGDAAARKSRKSSIWPETDVSVRKSFSFAHKG